MRISIKRSLCAAVAAAVVFFSVFSLASCDKRKETKNRIFYDYFDTVSVIYDYSGASDEDFSRVCGEIEGLLSYYHGLFDIYSEEDGTAGLAKINAMAGKGAVKCDGELIDFLEYCVSLYELTDGYVNIAMGAVLSIWHDYREAGLKALSKAELPPAELLTAAAEHCDITKLKIDREASTVELLDPEMRLDVGAVGKGYATEKIAEYLKGQKLSGYVLDIGGNLRAVGTKPGGEGWSTGVKNPDVYSPERYVDTFTLSDSSAVTSGDYERYYVVDGKRYHHIIDKNTLMPARNFASVTVKCESSALADGLSTALFCMDYDTGRALVDSLDGVSAVWVTHDGAVLK